MNSSHPKIICLNALEQFQWKTLVASPRETERLESYADQVFLSLHDNSFLLK